MLSCNASSINSLFVHICKRFITLNILFLWIKRVNMRKLSVFLIVHFTWSIWFTCMWLHRHQPWQSFSVTTWNVGYMFWLPESFWLKASLVPKAAELTSTVSVCPEALIPAYFSYSGSYFLLVHTCSRVKLLFKCILTLSRIGKL